jgi:N-acetylmuramoyl-L-alanine amidase
MTRSRLTTVAFLSLVPALLLGWPLRAADDGEPRPAPATATAEADLAASPGRAPVRLPFWRGAELVAVEAGALAGRADGGDEDARLRRMVGLLVSPPPQLLGGTGLATSWPDGTRLVEMVRQNEAIVLRLDLPERFLLGGGVTDEWLERASRQLLALAQRFPGIHSIHFAARDPRAPEEGWVALPMFLPAFDPRSIEKERIAEGDRPEAIRADLPLVRRVSSPSPESGPDGLQPASTGFLTGKQVFLSQGHGWIDYNTTDAWETQRPLTNGIVEDFVNSEAADQYLLRYLENAGATVWPLREVDLNSSMVIVDSSDAAAHPTNGTYVESGDAGAFSNTGFSSFANFQAPYSSSEDPFRNAGSTSRALATAATETARATFTPLLPAEGDYEVWVSYTRNGDTGANDAHYIVSHTGGQTHFRVNQERHGWVWVRLGRFHFLAGSNAATGSVALANDSGETGKIVVADAVRFGGGMGDILGDYHGTVSGHPRWEEGARYFTQFQGGTSSVFGAGDVACRSKFAAWENYAGVEDSVFVSWHSNAYDGSARGTSSYIYSANPPDGTYDTTQATTGSVSLMNRVHDEIVADIRAAWDSAWTNLGYYSAYFGEINPSYNSEMPSALLEVAFHDNATDAAQMKDPRFRKIVSRAIYQGIVKYFATRDGTTPRLLPEPPDDPEAHSTSRTSVIVSWLPSPTDTTGVFGDAATSYKVYLSTDGKGFDNGTSTTSTSLKIYNLSPGALYFVRVTGLNLGGESLPTETLAVRTPAAMEPKALVVAGFDRISASQLVPQYEADLGGTVQRMYLWKMNDFSYPVQHGAALAAAGMAIDSASNEAVESGRIAPTPTTHKMIDWISGEESTQDETFSTSEQTAVTSFLSAGGGIFTSGAEIGWDLDAYGSTADRTFYESTLGCNYVSDDAGVSTSDGVAGTILAGVTGVAFDDGTGPTYNVDYPDVIGASGGSGTVCLRYQPAATGAGIQFSNGTWRTVDFGFPFETIVDSAKRNTVMDKVSKFLVPCVTPTLALKMTAARESSDHLGVTATVTDSNGSASVTGYDLVRSSTPSTSPTGWSAVVTNGVDEEGARTGIQVTDPVSPTTGTWFYSARARNARCGTTGPH